MARLKDRNRQIPNGMFIYVPQTKWRSRPGSFESVVSQLQQHLQGNPLLVRQLKWSTERAFLEDLVDAYNARVCQANGWKDFIIGSDGPPKTQPRSNQWWAPARAVAAGAATINDWLGAGAKPVAPELALSRAQVCVKCPKNQPGDWLAYFTVPAADLIRKELAKKAEMNISTPLDDQLHVCVACYCPLPLKVQCPIEHIKNRMPAAVKAELVPECWVLSEIKP